MNDLSEFLPTAGSKSTRGWMRRLAAIPSTTSKRGITLVLAGLMIPMALAPLSAFAQDAPPPPPDQQYDYDQGPPPPDDDAAPPQQWNELSPDQLNELVAPIALYPDSLVAQVLAASTYPTQVVEADRFVEAQGGAGPDQIAEMVNGQPWDPSVKALCAFPSVLSNMDKNLDWTTQLGNAYYNQPQDVMSAVQAMRQEAYERGDLRSGAQLNVDYEPGNIVIEPANPAVVYVPYYDPWAIYGFRPWYRWYAPPPPPGWRVGVRFGFGLGIVVGGGWGHYGWGYGHWGFAWGSHPYVAYNHVTYVSRSVTVVNHGYYGRFDRRPEARHYNVQAAHAAYAAGERNGFNRGVNRGESNGFNRGERNGYNNGFRNGYNRGNENNNRPNNNLARPPINQGRPQNNPNFNRPNTPDNNNRQNFNRPNSDLARPPQNNRNFDRPTMPNNNNNRPENRNFNRPNSNMARPPINQGRPQEQPHNEGRPSGGGGRPQGGGGGERPHGNGGGDHGDRGGHPHGH
ncbi:MAG TPA: DUF3300 domain-containing protein [Acidobacteriaceae bacterium]|nr:DUF3300 domain-containing protein [Acidobacteriaceae bacterium]